MANKKRPKKPLNKDLLIQEDGIKKEPEESEVSSPARTTRRTAAATGRKGAENPDILAAPAGGEGSARRRERSAAESRGYEGSSRRREARSVTETPTGTAARNVMGAREREDSFSSGMSLDVLAQVATETLQKEPVAAYRKALMRKPTPRSVDLLTVPQIRALSDKALVTMFSELNSNELRRHYSFTCCLMPESCSQQFSSFGNEDKAKLMMKSHLLSHLADLEKKGDPSFAAEPLQARKKRIAAEAAAQKKAKKKLKEWAAASGSTVGSGRSSAEAATTSSQYTSLKSTERHSRPSASPRAPRRPAAPDDEDASDASSDDEEDGERSGRPGRKRGRPAKKPLSRRFTHKKTHTLSSRGLLLDDDVDVEGTPAAVTREIMRGEAQVRREMAKTVAHNEQFVVDVLNRQQPFHDHSYTTVFGKRVGIETLQLDSETLDQLGVEEDTARTAGLKYKVTQEAHGCSNNAAGGGDGSNVSELPEGMAKTLTLRINAGSVPTMNNVHIPILRLERVPVGPDGTPLISAEEVVIQGSEAQLAGAGITTATLQGEEPEEYSGLVTSSAQKPYPPMPKCELARKGKVAVPEEELSSDDEGLMSPHGPSLAINTASLVMAARAHPGGPPVQTDTKRKMLSHGTAEWERKLALKCIRDLRGKKRDDEPLVCKICKDKEFTATATLMYHYRSHAGIKPFVCLICHTTFTRQHSLNYHMLIHNNQSRFTCKDCGRKFRHPSHFKEHLRRHTGETPFHCADCPLRFKTRNTYKRHLKTRHGKILTAEGIKPAAHPTEQQFFIQIPAPHSSKLRLQRDDSEEDVVDVEDGYLVQVEPEERVETVTTTEQHQYIIAQDQPHSSQHSATMYDTTAAPVTVAQLQYQPPADGAGGVVVEPTAAATSQLHSASSSQDNRLLQFCAQVVNQETV